MLQPVAHPMTHWSGHRDGRRGGHLAPGVKLLCLSSGTNISQTVSEVMKFCLANLELSVKKEVILKFKTFSEKAFVFLITYTVYE